MNRRRKAWIAGIAIFAAGSFSPETAVGADGGSGGAGGADPEVAEAEGRMGCANYRKIASEMRATSKKTNWPPDEAVASSFEDQARSCAEKARADVSERRRQQRITADLIAREARERAERQAFRAAEKAAADERDRAETEAQEKDAAKRETLRGDPNWMRPVLSAAICYDDWVYRRAEKEIKTEQSYAKRGGGMVDKRKIYRLQLHMRRATENREDATRELRGKPLPCSAKAVGYIVACMQDESACEASDAGIRASFFDIPDRPGWSCRGADCDDD